MQHAPWKILCWAGKMALKHFLLDSCLILFNLKLLGVYVWWMHVYKYMRMGSSLQVHENNRSWCQEVFLSCSHLIYWDKVSYWSRCSQFWLTWLASKPLESSCLCPSEMGYGCLPLSLALMLVLELQTLVLVLSGKTFYSLNHPSTSLKKSS